MTPVLTRWRRLTGTATATLAAVIITAAAALLLPVSLLRTALERHDDLFAGQLSEEKTPTEMEVRA